MCHVFLNLRSRHSVCSLAIAFLKLPIRHIAVDRLMRSYFVIDRAGSRLVIRRVPLVQALNSLEIRIGYAGHRVGALLS